MPDTTARISDGDRLADVSASGMGAGGHDGRVPLPVAAGVGRRSMRIAVLSGQPRTCRPRGLPWPAGRAHGRTLGAGGVRRLAVAVRTGSRPIGWAVTSNWGCPADRTVKRSARSIARPATARVSAGGTDRRRRCPGGCRASAPWRKGRPAGLRACPASHGEVLEVPTGRSRVGCAGRPAAPARRPAFRHRSADGRGWAGGSAGIGERLLSVGAGGPGGGFCSTSVVSRRADRLAAGESLGRSCRGRAQHQEANRTHPVSEVKLNSLSIYQTLLSQFSPFSPATPSSLQPHASYYLPAYAILLRAILTAIPVVLHIRISDARLPAWRGREGSGRWRCR
jgi:hypothetical protein